MRLQPLWRATLTTLALAGLALPASAAIPASERAVLDAIYASTDGGNWDNTIANNDVWGGAPGSECSWYGITCAGDHVIEIDLQNNALTDTLPDLSGLTALTDFNVRGNDLSGPIPDLSAMAALEYFQVLDNDLSGPLPALPASIKYFDASNNHLSGPIPDLSALTSLQQFYGERNQLSGPMPGLPPFIYAFWV